MVLGRTSLTGGLGCGAERMLDSLGQWLVDEAGIAQREQSYAGTADRSWRFRLGIVRLYCDRPKKGDPFFSPLLLDFLSPFHPFS
jgi:hypothetical protein